MRMKRAVLLLLALLWLLCVPHASMAVPAFPGLVELTDEATGSTVQCALRGDESFSYMVDAQERVVVTDAQGCLRYVIRDGSGYALGGYLGDEGGSRAVGSTAVGIGIARTSCSACNRVDVSLTVLYTAVSFG